MQFEKQNMKNRSNNFQNVKYQNKNTKHKYLDKILQNQFKTFQNNKSISENKRTLLVDGYYNDNISYKQSNTYNRMLQSTQGSQINGFIITQQTTDQLSSREVIDYFYYSDTLQAFLLLSHSQDFIYFNSNQSDLSLKEQILIRFSQRNNSRKYVRKFYYSETLKYILILIDDQPFSQLDSQESFLNNIAGLSSVIEIYSLSVNQQIAEIQLIQTITGIQPPNLSQSEDQYISILDFDVNVDENKFVIVTSTTIQIYETNTQINLNFELLFSITKEKDPFTNGFIDIFYAQNLIIIVNSKLGLLAYRTDTKIWFAGQISYSGALTQYLYQSKIYFIFKDQSIFQGSLTAFQLVLQDKPIEKLLTADSTKLFDKTPQSITISQNFLFALIQSDTIVIYEISEAVQKSNFFEFKLLQILRTQQNIIQIQMVTSVLVILNFKQLTSFQRLNEAKPKQLDYISILPSQRRWFTGTTGYVPPNKCTYYENQVYIVTQNSLLINSEDSTKTVAITLQSTVNLFGIFATPSSYFILYSTLDLFIFSLVVSKVSDNRSTLQLSKTYSAVEQILQTFANCIFIRGQIIQANPTDPTFSKISIYNLANNYVLIQVNIPDSLKNIQCNFIQYNILNNKVYFVSNKQIFEISNNFEVSLFYDFTKIVSEEKIKCRRIFFSSENVYVIFNFGIDIYEITISTKQVIMITIPFKISRLYPQGNLLILTNQSQIAIYEKKSDNIILFKPMNENNSDQIICIDSQQSLKKRFSFVQSNKVVEYQFQKYQENIIIVLLNKNIPIQLGSKLEFEYYVSDLNDQSLKLQFIQQDEGLNQYFIDFSISSLGHVYIDSSKIEFKEIGNNVLLTAQRKNDGIESCLILLSFHQKLNNLTKESLEVLLTANQITSEGYIISEGLQTTLNTLSIAESEKQKIRNSIIRVHFPIQIKESLIFDEMNLIQFNTPSTNVKITLSLINKYYEFILKSVFISEITESVDWYISNDKSLMVISGSPVKVKKFIMYFMLRKVKESDEQIIVGFSDFINSERRITLSLNEFKQSNKYLLQEIKGLVVENKLQDMFNDIYDSQNLSIEQLQFQIPKNTYVDSDIRSFQGVLLDSLPFYEEKNNINIYYQFFYTQSNQKLDYSDIFVDKQELKLLSEQTGVVISSDTIFISINNLREYSLLKKQAEYHRIIICAVNEINRVCDEFSFTLSYSNTLNMLILVLVPIASFLVFYYIYKKMYVIKFFWNMYKVTYSDEKIYTNNLYHKQIPIIFDQYDIAKELWNYYYAVRIVKIEKKEAFEKCYLDDEDAGQGKFDDQLYGKGSSENAVTAATATLAQNGQGGHQNKNYPSVKDSLNKKSSEMQNVQNEGNISNRQFFNTNKQSSLNSQDLIQNISNIAGLTSGRDASTNNLKGNLGEDFYSQFPSKNITPENSMLKIPLSNIDMKDCSFCNTNITPINNDQQGEYNQNFGFTEQSAIQQPYQFQAQFQPQQQVQQQPDQFFNQQIDLSFNQQKDQNEQQIKEQEQQQTQQLQLQQQQYLNQYEQTLNTEQNSPIDTKRSNLINKNIKQDQENSNNMSFYQSQMDYTDMTYNNPYQSYQEFIFQNRKIQIINNNNNSATLKTPLRNDGFGDPSEPYLQFTKFQGPPLSNYQIHSLQRVIGQQKYEDEKNSQLFEKCFQQNKIQYDKTNSNIVKDLINNSKVFNKKVFKLLQNTQQQNAIPTTFANEQSDKLYEDLGSPLQSNKQSFKKQNTLSSNTFFKRRQVQGLIKTLTAHSKSISKQVEDIKANFSKLVRDQLSLKTQENKRINNLKDEGLIDEFGCINEEIFIDDVKKQLKTYFEQKIKTGINVKKLQFLLSQVDNLDFKQCQISRYLFVEFSRHILTIDYISLHMYQYLKSLSLLYNNLNDWYKSYLYIIGHDQDNQIYPFPSVIVKDDMVYQAINDLNIKAYGKECNIKEKIKIVGQALTADSFDLNKYQNGCGEALWLDSSDEIQTIKAINIQDKISGRMRQFVNFLSWMFGDFEKQQLLNDQLVPEWLVCGTTYNTIHIKGNPNNSQVGRYLILVSGKKKNILRSFILKVVKYQDTHSKLKRQQQFDQASNMYDSRALINMNDFTYDNNMLQSHAGFKKEDMKNSLDYSKQMSLRKQFSKEQITKQDNQNSSNNKYQPKNKSLFQKNNAPHKSNSIYLNSPKNSQQNISSFTQKQTDKSDIVRQRVFSEYLDYKSAPLNPVRSKTNELNEIDEQTQNEQLTSINTNNQKIKPSSEDNINDNDSEIKTSHISENRTIVNHLTQLEGIKGTKFFPNQNENYDD